MFKYYTGIAVLLILHEDVQAKMHCTKSRPWSVKLVRGDLIQRNIKQKRTIPEVTLYKYMDKEP